MVLPSGTALVVPAASGRATAGTTRAVPDGSTTHSSADRIVVNSFSYSWILAIVWVYSPLKSTSSMIAFYHHKRSWNLSISLASDPSDGRNSLLEFLSHANFCRVIQATRGSPQSYPGRRSVTNLSQSITGQSEVGRKCIMADRLWSSFWRLCR